MNELSYLYSLQQFGIKLGLSNIKALCDILDNPQDKIKTIHIGGTNGKGSTAAIISTILQKAGYKTGLYTSPHLTAFSERIRINNVPIPGERTSALIRHIKECISEMEIAPTFFEFTTAMALQYFAEEGVDIAIMEVGMGGRLDATNIIVPLLSVITNIEYDHTEYLGKTLEEIAAEKCGIIKQGVSLISSERRPGIASVIEEIALGAGSQAYLYCRDFVAEPVEIGRNQSKFFYSGRKYKRLFLETALLGRHQMLNMGTALYAAELLSEMGFNLTVENLTAGVRDVVWPGRLETLAGRPGFLLDGAHNHSASIVLRAFIEDVLKGDRHINKVVMIFGALRDKDVSSMLQELIPCVTDIILTMPDTDRGLPVDELMEIAAESGRNFRAFSTLSDAISAARGITSDSDIVLITGSLYLVGEARTLLSGRLVSR
ncbi:MAG: bifunctional folylpolyglutamate synthase/dihydrofolate synthase [Nitrospirae bacterium]|nr:bifunctional folylpolyglutamate synthase/dihydrofolate synthase [Nitrospirota bacterium]